MQSDAVRLDWSRWSRCESSFNLLLTPHQPGIFALAEEVVDAAAAGGLDQKNGDGAPGAPGFGARGYKRMLAVLEVATADDLSRTLSSLFSPASALRERLLSGNCFIRYAVVTDAMQRDLIAGQLQQWISASAEAASGIVQSFSAPGVASEAGADAARTSDKLRGVAQTLPAGF
ncbi:MAG: hypothetical protein M3P27_02020 [Acidobacteriota bacterium]|nr:hypothetical protein [Acidobacteriota bacterium]